MSRALNLDELATIIEWHPTEFSTVARQSVIGIDDIAHAISRMAVDPEVSRSIVAIATRADRSGVSGGMWCLMQATMILAATVAATPSHDLAETFYKGIIPEFGNEVGSLQ